MKVRLLSAVLVPDVVPFWYNSGEFAIEVENLAYEKQVLIHFDNGWEGQAHYAKPLPDNRELWTWTTPWRIGKGFSPLKFCIKYVAGGETYWDNNGGWDYCLDSNHPRAPAAW